MAPEFVTAGTRAYVVREDGYCPALECWIAYTHDGKLVTIPA